MTRKIGLAVLLCTLCTVAAPGLDFNGKWTENAKGPNGNLQTILFDFHVDGSTLTGKAIFPGRELDIANGKVDGNSISFDLVMGSNGNSRTIHYKGTAEGDTIRFTRQMIQAPVEFVATRAPEAAAPAPAQSGRQISPAILIEPTDWRFERMPTPPGFAPDIQLSGFEEARFAPGMFDNSSPTYFTYVMVVSADGAPALDSAALTDFLDKYYRGLSVGVGRRRGLSPDPSQINADVVPDPASPGRYNAKVTFLDSFTDGRKITLNIEARVVPQHAAKKTDLVLLVSPQSKNNAVWQTLDEIGDKIDFNR